MFQTKQNLKKNNRLNVNKKKMMRLEYEKNFLHYFIVRTHFFLSFFFMYQRLTWQIKGQK